MRTLMFIKIALEHYTITINVTYKHSNGKILLEKPNSLANSDTYYVFDLTIIVHFRSKNNTFRLYAINTSILQDNIDSLTYIGVYII